jgi:hypothetical protein
MGIRAFPAWNGHGSEVAQQRNDTRGRSPSASLKPRRYGHSMVMDHGWECPVCGTKNPEEVDLCVRCGRNRNRVRRVIEPPRFSWWRFRKARIKYYDDAYKLGYLKRPRRGTEEWKRRHRGS